MQIDVWNISGAGFHFGRHGLGQEESGVNLPSDSLFSALAARKAALHGAAGLEAWVELFLKDPPPFVCSSAFPFGGEVRFYPLPLRRAPAPPNGAIKDHKKVKQVQFVSEVIFLAILSGEALETYLTPENLLHNGCLLVTTNERKKLPERLRSGEIRLWVQERRPRVAIGRISQNSTLYFTGRTAFAPGCGLWFGVRWLKPEVQTKIGLDELLADLGDAGLGGERASGFGQARITRAGQLHLPGSEGTAWVALSRYLPHPEDGPALTYRQAAYSVETVGGWVESPGKPAERRRNLRMVSEGSVLGPISRAVPGLVVDVQPDYGGGLRPIGHPVWRSGLALAAGFKPGVLQEE